MEKPILFLIPLLLFTQFLLSLKQIKIGASDGKILLVITIVVTLLWVPITILYLLLSNLIFHIVWIVLSLLYMIFTLWYTHNLQKTKP